MRAIKRIRPGQGQMSILPKKDGWQLDPQTKALGLRWVKIAREQLKGSKDV